MLIDVTRQMNEKRSEKRPKGMQIKPYELEFDSEFQNGNLDLVCREKNGEYDLLMRTDSNTRGHHQWFHFSIKNGKTIGTRRFNILNFTKKDSLYTHGMRIAIYSTRKAELAKNDKLPSIYVDWHRGGENIEYKLSKLSNENMLIAGKTGRMTCVQWLSSLNPNKKQYYSLSFDYEFEYPDDIVYFAYSVPYTYTDLTNLLTQIKEQHSKLLPAQQFLNEEILCKSLSGLDIPLLTITNSTTTSQNTKLDEMVNNFNINMAEEDSETEAYVAELKRLIENTKNERKPVVFITARIHPGETCGSFMMQGFLKFITSNICDAVELRNKIIFKIIPMINPDGVIVGNYRACLSGQDLNRKFQNPDVRLHPEICAIKRLIFETKSAGYKILGYFDLHAHSKKKCVFIYGPYYPLHSTRYLKVRVFAKLLSSFTEMFRFKACKFRQDQDKMTAARLVISREFDIMNSFTIEASFYGFIDDERKTVEFSQAFYEMMGKYINDALFDYYNLLEEERISRLHRVCLKKFKKQKKHIILAKKLSAINQNDKPTEKEKSNSPVKSRESIKPEQKRHAENSGDANGTLIHLKTIRVEDSYKNPEMYNKKVRANPKLAEIYESIQEDIEKDEEENKENGFSSSDSDSAESENDPLTKEEEATAIKAILETVEGFSKSAGNSPKDAYKELAIKGKSVRDPRKQKKKIKKKSRIENIAKNQKIPLEKPEEEQVIKKLSEKNVINARPNHSKLYEDYVKKNSLNLQQYDEIVEPELNKNLSIHSHIGNAIITASMPKVLPDSTASLLPAPLQMGMKIMSQPITYTTSKRNTVPLCMPQNRRAPTPGPITNFTDERPLPKVFHPSKIDPANNLFHEDNTRNALNEVFGTNSCQNRVKTAIRNDIIPIPKNSHQLSNIQIQPLPTRPAPTKHQEILRFLNSAIRQTSEEYAQCNNGFVPTDRVKRTTHSSSIKSRAIINKCADKLKANRIGSEGTRTFGVAYNLVYVENGESNTNNLVIPKRAYTCTRPRAVENDLKKLTSWHKKISKYGHK